MEGLVFTENNLISPVFNTCKKILGNITDMRGKNVTSYLNTVETLIWNMAFKGSKLFMQLSSVKPLIPKKIKKFSLILTIRLVQNHIYFPWEGPGFLPLIGGGARCNGGGCRPPETA